jgi:predicted acyltransferase
MSSHFRDQPNRKVLSLAAAAVSLIAIGGLWNLVFPINKYLWSSSFVCFVGGLSMLLFTLFYLVIDIWKFRRSTTFFVVIGMNSITIYLGRQLIDFGHAANFLFGGVYALVPAGWHNLVVATGEFATAWLFLYFLYKKRWFFRV